MAQTAVQLLPETPELAAFNEGLAALFLDLQKINDYLAVVFKLATAAPSDPANRLLALRLGSFLQGENALAAEIGKLLAL